MGAKRYATLYMKGHGRVAPGTAERHLAVYVVFPADVDAAAKLWNEPGATAAEAHVHECGAREPTPQKRACRGQKTGVLAVLSPEQLDEGSIVHRGRR
jgi:hypothetical protein